MPKYAVILHHPPDNCPLTNKSVREFFKKTLAELPNVAKQLGVKMEMLIHLDPAHKAMMSLDAPNAEAARDFLVRGGFFHFTEMEFYFVTPMDELAKHVDEFPTIY